MQLSLCAKAPFSTSYESTNASDVNNFFFEGTGSFSGDYVKPLFDNLHLKAHVHIQIPIKTYKPNTVLPSRWWKLVSYGGNWARKFNGEFAVSCRFQQPGGLGLEGGWHYMQFYD